MIKVIISASKKPLSFDYKSKLAGFCYNMLDGAYHGEAKFVVSNIYNTKFTNDGIDVKEDGYFFINSTDIDLLSTFIRNTMIKTNEMFNGIKIKGFERVNTPYFEKCNIIKTLSPVLFRHNSKTITPFNDDNYNEKITEIVKNRLAKVGINDNSLKLEHLCVKQKNFAHKNVRNVCVEGTFKITASEETKAYLYAKGLGDSTSIGYGCVKLMY